jgi:hypothetical protein
MRARRPMTVLGWVEVLGPILWSTPLLPNVGLRSRFSRWPSSAVGLAGAGARQSATIDAWPSKVNRLLD